MRSTNWFLAACVVAAGLSTAAAQTSPAPGRFVVVLDAAHGGDDPGGRLSNNQPEKAFTLALSVRLRSLLAARGFQVVTTRESDTTLDATHRAETANHANAQACLTLHASESGSGVHIFASSLAPVQQGRFSAWRTIQAASVQRSLALAGVLNSGLSHAGVNVTLGRTALLEVDSMACPAVAVEVSPDRSPDRKITANLDNQGYLSRVTDALAAALMEWRGEAHP